MAFYPDGVEPRPEGEQGKPLRIGSTLEVEVGPDADLRSVMRGAVRADESLGPRLERGLDSDQYRLLPLPSEVSAESWSVDQWPEGINYTIDNFFQTIVRHDVIHRPWSISLRELDELVDVGYVKGDPRELLVMIDWGLGGGDGLEDIVSWLLTHGVDIGIGWGGEKILGYLWTSITGRFRGSMRDRRARTVAAMWERNHFYRPTDLRTWIDLREVWDVAEVAKRLALVHRSAGQLLRSLGYEEERAGLWRSSTRWRAQRRRREWLRDEDEQTGFEELVPKGER